MVRSCTGWKRLSVNCSSKHDLPTPVSPMMIYLNRYAYDIAPTELGRLSESYRTMLHSSDAAAQRTGFAQLHEVIYSVESTRSRFQLLCSLQMGKE